MLLSPEIRRYSIIALSFRHLWAASVCRYRVRHAELGGVGEHGRVSAGLAWNTGYPSRRVEHIPDTGRHRITTTKGSCAGEAQAAARKETQSHQPSISLGKSTRQAGEEASGSLRLPIVAIEKWRTVDGQEPVSSEGGVPNIGTNATIHGHNPPRK
jgi:hypothetical protein